MPIPMHFTPWQKIRAWLTWADLDEAAGTRPLRLYKRFFRWLGL